jgi:hypothetical protein
VSERIGVLLAAFGVVVFGGARLFVGPPYQVYDPIGARLVDGLPVTWEMIYYLVHLPTFLGDGPPAHTIGPVHYRALSGLHLASLLTVWLGSRFWAFALVDLLLWFLAVLATYQLALRLGAGRAAARSAALLCLASPIFVATMWTHVLHPAEFASLPIGLWAAKVLVDEARGRVRLAIALGGLLVLLSVSYQYQWIVLPLLMVLLLGSGGHSWRQALRVTAGALAVYVVASLGIRALLIVGRLDPLTNPLAEHMQAVAEPVGLLSGRWNEFLSSGDPRALLPRPDHFSAMAQVYHPLVFAFGVGGALQCSHTVRWMTLLASAISLVSFVLYPAPWTAMSAFPLLYVGAGVGCAAAGAAAARLARGLPAMRRTANLVSAVCALVLAAATNLDLAGDHSYLLEWWRLYYPQSLF